MNLKQTLLILLILLLSANAISMEIQFYGSRPFNYKSIVNRLKNESNPSFELLDSVTNALTDNAYLDAAMTVKDSKLILACGPRYMLSKLVLVEDSTYEKEINLPFDSINTAFAVETYLQNYRNVGYLYAVASTNSISLIDSTVILTVKVNKGPQVKYGRPVFAGLTRTDSKMVERYLPKNTDGALTRDYINSVNDAVGQISFVKLAEPPSVQPRPGYTVSDLVLKFIEQTPVRFDGAAGISGGDNNYPVWSFNLRLINLFGQGKEVRLKSERPDDRRSLLNVGYAQPLFLLGLGELNLNVQTRDYREEFYEFALSGGYQTRINSDLKTGLAFEWKSSKPEAGGSAYNRYTGQFSIGRKTFNDDFNPKSGMLLTWSIDFSFRRYTASTLPLKISSRTFNETRNRLSTDFYQPIIGVLQLRTSLNYVGLESGEDLPPLSELIFIGGPGTIRGYRDEQFSAIRTAFGTIEPRLRFSQGFISIFYDAAYLNNRIGNSNNSVVTSEEYKWSYGLGIGIGDGSRSVSLSLGINPEQGISEPRLSIELSSDL